MGLAGNTKDRQLTALLIAPDRELARQFGEMLPAVSGFQILADLRAYPAEQTLDMRLRQLQPEVVLLDLATNFEQASEVIRCVIKLNPAIHVVGLHTHRDSDAILSALRQGASEFLCAPFDAAVQRQALARIRRLIDPGPSSSGRTGTVVVFTSAKPGSGASTLATQLGFALSRQAGKKILLADLDPMAATVSFYLKLGAGDEPSGADPWSRVVPGERGPDTLPARGAAEPPLGAPALHEFLERARGMYDWIVLDLPAVFHRSSLLVLPEADRAYLVTTAELPSLHLARKAVAFLAQLGFGRDRVRVLVNRVERRSALATSDVEKMLNAPVQGSFPDDCSALDRASSGGEALPSGSALRKEIEAFATALAGAADGEPRRAHTGAPEAPRAEIRV